MRRLSFVLALLLVGCSQPSAPVDEDSNDSVSVNDNTRLVENPPTYESVPLPDGLVWVTNDDDPVFASPDAKRGGTFTTYLTSFPVTLRMYGPDAASGTFVAMKRAMFMSLVDLHPNTLNFIPALATHWAFGEDGKTVYYKLDPRARWSDGVPITADDYLFARDMLRSQYVVDPYTQNYFNDVVVDVVKHDDYTISVVGATALPRNEMLYQYSMQPEPRHFHRLDASWVQDYNWRVEPNTGPYQISAVEKGRYIEYTRKQDWWANDLKYYRNRFNPDKIRIEVIRDDNVAFEYFLRGEVDAYPFHASVTRWHDRARGELFDRGLIDKIQFYNDVPEPGRGIWLNMDDPLLADRNVRYGLAHAFNMDRAIAGVFRGDYERLQHQFEGFYWGYTNPDIHVREFDLSLADKYLDAAGWTERGPDGIRVKDGRRLSIRVTYASDDHSPWLVVVREEARKAGVELNLQLLDPSAWSTMIGEKTYQAVVIVFSTNLTPSFWQGYHSKNAHKPQTNNVTNTDDPEIDALIDAFEAESDLDKRIELAHRIEELVHATGGFLPAYKIPYTRDAYWRWLKLPAAHGTRTSTRTLDVFGEIFDPFKAGLFWIDEDAKAKTLEALDNGGSFEPVDIVDTTWRVD